MTTWDELVEGVAPELRDRFRLDRIPFESDGAPFGELLSLAGRTVVVTGGGGDDIGRALCHRLAQQGATVVVLDVDAAAAARVARQVSERTNSATLAVAADVTDWDEVRAAIDRVMDHFGDLDVLVNNAGGALGTHGPYATRERHDIDSVLSLNLTGVLYATHAALGPMLARGRGRIITVASEGGRLAMRDLAGYNTAKAGVLAFMRNLSREVGARGVSTVSVCPGALVAPRLLDRMKAYPAPLSSAIEQGFDATSLGRFGLPDEVAMLVAYLASDAGSLIHGTEISISGGQSA